MTAAEERDESMTTDALSKTTVLVVDDEAFALRLVTRVLEKLGVGAVVTAGNGNEAIAVLGDESQAIDLVISDIEMPEMDGWELARKIRYGVVPQYKEVPILMLTGQDTEDNVKKGRIHKIEGFIVKPPKADVLQSYLAKVLG